MSIEILKATARCSDCLAEIEGGMQLDAGPDIYAVLVCEVRGDLITICDKHHDTNRSFGTNSEDEAPQHDYFYVIVFGKSIGILGPVSSKAAVTKLFITDTALAKQFYDEVLLPLQKIGK